MNIKKRREALSSGMPEESMRRAIISIIAEDKEAISDILKILSFERDVKNELISEMNVNLGKADLCIENSSWFDGSKKGSGKEFVKKGIADFYDQFAGYVRNPFRRTKSKVK